MLCACATRPATHSFVNTRTYQKPYDAVWEDIVGFFAANNIQVKNIAKDSGVIYAETTRFDESVADCGKPGIFRVIETNARFNVFVSRTTANPNVSVNAEYGQVWRFDNNVQKIACNSRGTLEQRILDAVRP